MADLSISVDIDARGARVGGATAKSEIKAVGDEAEKTGRKVRSAADKDFATFNKQLGEASQLVSELAQSMGGLTGNLLASVAAAGPAGAAIAALGIAAVVTGGAVFALTKRFAEYVKVVGDASDETGLSIQLMSSLRYAVESTGGSFDGLIGGVRAFTKTIGDANNGNKEASAKLIRLGIDGQAAAANLEEAFKAVIQKIASLPEGVQRGSAAMDAFGESGTKLLPMIKAFNGDVDAMIAKAKELGATLSVDDVRAAAEFNKAFAEVEAQVQQVTIAFGRELMPTVQDTLNNINVWLGQNKGEVKSWATYVADTVRELVLDVKQEINDVKAMWDWLVGDYRAAVIKSNYQSPEDAAKTMADAAERMRQYESTGIAIQLKRARGNRSNDTLAQQPDDYAAYLAGKLPFATSPYNAGGPGRTTGSTGGGGSPRDVLPAFGSMRNLVISSGNAAWDSYFVQMGSKFGVDPNVLLLQALNESGFKKGATSPKGAQGFSQFMPATAKRFGVNTSSISDSIRGQAEYMSLLLSMFGGDYSLALAGYNAGEESVQKFGNRIPPFKETRNYVSKIKAAYSSRVRKGSEYGTFDYGVDDGTIAYKGTVSDTLDLASKQRAIDLGNEQIEVYKRMSDALFNLTTHTKEESFMQDVLMGRYKMLTPEMIENMRVTYQLMDADDARKRSLDAYTDTLTDLDDQIQQLNVQLGLSAELTRADAVAKLIASEAGLKMTEAEKTELRTKAELVDTLKAATKAQAEYQRQYEETFYVIRDSLGILADEGFGAFFKDIGRRFKNFLLDMAAQWLTSKFFELFYKGGNQKAAAGAVGSGNGGGGIMGAISSIFGIGQGQGPGGTGVFNPGYFVPGGSGSDAGLPTWSGTGLGRGPTLNGGAAGGGILSQIFGKGGIFGAKGFGANVGTFTGIGTIGAILGGAIGGRAGGFISNIGTGVALGAQIGSIIPGIGTVIGAAVGGVVGFFASLFGGNKQEKRDKKEKMPELTKGFTEALAQLRALAADRNALMRDPGGVLNRAMEIRTQIAGGFGIQFESRKYQRESQSQISQRLVEADAIIAEIKKLSEISYAAGDRDRRLLPEFAGGVYMSPAFQNFRRRNGMLGGVWTGRDTIPAMLAQGEAVLNPRQMQTIRSHAGFDVFKTAGIPGYAGGGMAGSQGMANGPVVVQVSLSQDAAGMWHATAKSDSGRKVLLEVVSDGFANDEITTRRR